MILRIFGYLSGKLSGTSISKNPTVKRVYRSIYKALKPKKQPLIKCHNISLYLDPDSRSITPDFLINGSYEEYETGLFKNAIKPGMVVVDVGANIGYYALIAARLVGENGKVYAFEPSPKNFELLLKNIELNKFNNVIAINKAISDKTGKTRLYIGSDNSGGPSLSRFNGRFDHTVEVDTIDLDSYFNENARDVKIDILKTDTEGAKGLVLKGAKNIVRSNDLTIFMEFWPYGLHTMGSEPADLINSLKSSGYRIKTIDARNRLLDESDETITRICHGSRRDMINLLAVK